MTPTGSARFFLVTCSLSAFLEARFKLNPMVPSVATVRRPKVSLSQSGIKAAKQALRTEKEPNMLTPDQASPALPRFPSASCSAVLEPISAVRPAISIRPEPTDCATPWPCPSLLVCDALTAE